MLHSVPVGLAQSKQSAPQAFIDVLSVCQEHMPSEADVLLRLYQAVQVHGDRFAIGGPAEPHLLAAWAAQC